MPGLASIAEVKPSVADVTIVSTIPGSAPISVMTFPAASVAALSASEGEPPEFSTEV